jgi:hypothetical protein
MRTRYGADAELQLLATVRQSVPAQGGEPASQVDELLDEGGLSFGVQ